MSFELKTADQKLLVDAVDKILEAFKNGDASQAQANFALTHLIVAAGNDNEKEVRDWLDPERVVNWKRLCKET